MSKSPEIEVEIIHEPDSTKNFKSSWAQEFNRKLDKYYAIFANLLQKIPSKSRNILATIFIFIGILGIMLPLMPGWSFLIIGVTFFSEKYGLWLLSFVKKFLIWAEKTWKLILAKSK